MMERLRIQNVDPEQQLPMDYPVDVTNSAASSVVAFPQEYRDSALGATITGHASTPFTIQMPAGAFGQSERVFLIEGPPGTLNPSTNIVQLPAQQLPIDFEGLIDIDNEETLSARREERRLRREENQMAPEIWMANPGIIVKKALSKAAKWKKLVETIKPIMDAIFPEAWDITFVIRTDFSFLEEDDGTEGGVGAWITVLYKDLIIRRSDGHRKPHQLRDLYVRFYINDNLALTSNIRGTRGELTIAEYSSDYAHSHISSMNGFTNFCLGSTFLRDFASRIGNEGFFDDEGNLKGDFLLTFEAFLHQIEAFVSHEATEGKPHRLISTIGNGTSIRIDDNDRIRSMQNFVRESMNKELPIVFENNVPVLVYNSELEKILVRAATKRQFMAFDGTMYSTINEYTQGDDSIMRNPGFESFIFRGQLVQQTITYPLGCDTSNKKLYCHEEIRKYIITTINTRIQEGYLKGGIEATYQRILERSSSTRSWKTNSKTQSFLEALEPIVQNSHDGVERSYVLSDDWGGPPAA